MITWRMRIACWIPKARIQTHTRNITVYCSRQNNTKHMVTSRDQNAGRSHSIKIDNSSFEKVEQFKYLGTSLTDQNSIQEDI